jgi:hypothetical protein
MSEERDYRLYVKKYHQGIDKDGKVDLAAIALKYKLPKGDKRDTIDDTRLRAVISQRLGAAEEDLHGTYRDSDTNQRRKIVPEANAKFHRRLVDELYHSLTPPEPAVTADSADTDETGLL